jgi:cysteine-rich repeat protein
LFCNTSVPLATPLTAPPTRATAATAPVASRGCGDGVKVTSEECDDGNRTAGDGCDSSCHAETVLM